MPDAMVPFKVKRKPESLEAVMESASTQSQRFAKSEKVSQSLEVIPSLVQKGMN